MFNEYFFARVDIGMSIRLNICCLTDRVDEVTACERDIDKAWTGDRYGLNEAFLVHIEIFDEFAGDIARILAKLFCHSKRRIGRIVAMCHILGVFDSKYCVTYTKQALERLGDISMEIVLHGWILALFPNKKPVIIRV